MEPGATDDEAGFAFIVAVFDAVIDGFAMPKSDRVPLTDSFSMSFVPGIFLAEAVEVEGAAYAE